MQNILACHPSASVLDVVNDVQVARGTANPLVECRHMGYIKYIKKIIILINVARKSEMNKKLR